MKTKLTLLTLLIIAAVGAKAQNLIAVQHAGKSAFYTKLPDAITGALAGDTVYVPGGSFDGITISKKLCLIGAGHNPDSTKVTSRTTISSITFGKGADYGSITGIYVLQMQRSGPFSNYAISRCKINSLSFGTFASDSLNNFSLNENIIGSLLVYGTNNYFNNNVFMGLIQIIDLGTINYTIVKNNVFLGIGGNFFYRDHCIVENNLFEQNTSTISTTYGDNNIFFNNLMIGNGQYGKNQGNGNYQDNVLLSTVFIHYDPSNVDGDTIYKQDFNLPPGSPYKNAGTDGTDLGIYGGAFPWKPGSLPSNPHFQSINIAPTTDASGNLKVQITVAAQDH